MAKTRTTAALTVGFSLHRGAKVAIAGPVIGRTSIFFGGGSSDPFTAVRIGFGIDDGGPSWFFQEPAIFYRHIITPADVGKTFYEDATTDPNFAAVVSRLTNGVDDLTFLCTKYVPDNGSGGGSGVDESSAFRGSTLTNGIDFAGQRIARIGMCLDVLKFFVADEEIEGQVHPLYRFEGYVTILIERNWDIKTAVSFSSQD